MFQIEDDVFVQSLIDSDSRTEAIRRWRRSRIYSLVPVVCSFAAVVVAFVGDQAAMCGLYSGIAAISFAVVVSIDQKIKFALLIDELSQKIEFAQRIEELKKS